MSPHRHLQETDPAGGQTMVVSVKQWNRVVHMVQMLLAAAILTFAVAVVSALLLNRANHKSDQTAQQADKAIAAAVAAETAARTASETSARTDQVINGVLTAAARNTGAAQLARERIAATCSLLLGDTCPSQPTAGDAGLELPTTTTTTPGN